MRQRRRVSVRSQADGPDTPQGDGPRCGLCGKAGDLTRTECCGNWICDDEDQYVMFSFARNSCHRNHTRYTLCSMHFQEGHEGAWQTCKKCLGDVPTEMYVWYGTNEYNFEVLESPPSFEPTLCAKCGAVIRLAYDGYSISPQKSYLCTKCFPVPGAVLPKPRRRKRM